MPVYWYALSQTNSISTTNAIQVFLILHLLVYPASNGYNSYMDRDTGSIGGIKKPMAPTKQLFHVSMLLDIISVLWSGYLSIYFALGILAYIISSRAYSYRGIRLKKYPLTGYLTVIFFQGAVTFFLVVHGASTDHTMQVSMPGMVAASLLIGGFYPLTQIYQHQQDAADGVTTLSMKLGLNGTFVFTALIYLLAVATLALQLCLALQIAGFFIIQIFFLPILVYFFWWWQQVYKNSVAANFENTMRMNLLASFCSNAAFIMLFIIEKF